VVRHAQSTWNQQHRWAGQRDPGLSAQGRTAASALAARLAALRPPAGSEPWGAFTDRVLTALGELAVTGSETGVVVAHQGVLRALEHHFGVAPCPAAELGACGCVLSTRSLPGSHAGDGPIRQFDWDRTAARAPTSVATMGGCLRFDGNASDRVATDTGEASGVPRFGATNPP
jgi:hypothetical protein